MSPADITFWTRVAESSPLIVVILLGGIALGYRIIHLLVGRLDRKDEIIVDMQRETLEAISDMKSVIEKLTHALERSR